MQTRTLILMLSFVCLACTGMADEAEKDEAVQSAAKKDEKDAKAESAKKDEAARTHEIEAEIVSVDATAKTVTIKGEDENQKLAVAAKALADVKELKAGQEANLICKDDEKGEHKIVVGVKKAESGEKESGETTDEG